jgi:hypothetical protein
MSARADRLARVRAATDRRHGEKISVSPMASGGQWASPTGDPAREPFDVFGQVLVGAGGQAGFGQKADLQIPDGKAEAYVDPAVWPKITTLKAGDIIRGEDHAGTEFEVERLDRHQLGRLVIRLSVKEACR